MSSIGLLRSALSTVRSSWRQARRSRTSRHPMPMRQSKPFAPFLFSLACEQNAAILPAHVFCGSDVLRHPASLAQPVGEGPFQLTEWVRGDHLTLVRNPGYWFKDQPYLDRIIIKIIPDAAARLLALQAGLHRPILLSPQRLRRSRKRSALCAQGSELPEPRYCHPQYAQAATRPGRGAPCFADGH